MSKYQVKPGFTHGRFNQYKAGDVVELTEQEAAGFLDKLVLVGESQPYEVRPNLTITGGLLVTQEELDKAKAAAQGTPTGDGSNGDSDAPKDDIPVDFDVAAATVDEVLAAVSEGKIAADAALIAEQQNKKRAGLLKELTKLVEAAGAPTNENQPQE